MSLSDEYSLTRHWGLAMFEDASIVSDQRSSSSSINTESEIKSTSFKVRSSCFRPPPGAIRDSGPVKEATNQSD
jgi:hypothetical protein